MAEFAADLVEHLQRFAPCSLLRIVDLAEVQDGALNDLAGGDTVVLDNAEIAVLLAVLSPLVRSQEHGLIVHAAESTSRG